MEAVTLLLVEEHQAVVLEELVEQEQILVHRFQVYLKQHLLVEEVVVELSGGGGGTGGGGAGNSGGNGTGNTGGGGVVLEDQISVAEMVDQVL